MVEPPLWLSVSHPAVLAEMAHFRDDPPSDTVLQKIRAVFDSVRPLLIHGFKDVISVTYIASLRKFKDGQSLQK